MVRILFILLILSPVFLSAEPRLEKLFVCKARNLAGRRFSAIGPDEVLTQEKAMRKCESVSAQCYPTGCEETN